MHPWLSLGCSLFCAGRMLTTVAIPLLDDRIPYSQDLVFSEAMGSYGYFQNIDRHQTVEINAASARNGRSIRTLEISPHRNRVYAKDTSDRQGPAREARKEISELLSQQEQQPDYQRRKLSTYVLSSRRKLSRIHKRSLLRRDPPAGRLLHQTVHGRNLRKSQYEFCSSMELYLMIEELLERGMVRRDYDALSTVKFARGWFHYDFARHKLLLPHLGSSSDDLERTVEQDMKARLATMNDQGWQSFTAPHKAQPEADVRRG